MGIVANPGAEHKKPGTFDTRTTQMGSHDWQPFGPSTTPHHWLSQPAFCGERWRPERQDQHSVVIPPEARDYLCDSRPPDGVLDAR